MDAALSASRWFGGSSSRDAQHARRQRRSSSIRRVSPADGASRRRPRAWRSRGSSTRSRRRSFRPVEVRVGQRVSRGRLVQRSAATVRAASSDRRRRTTTNVRARRRTGRALRVEARAASSDRGLSPRRIVRRYLATRRRVGGSTANQGRSMFFGGRARVGRGRTDSSGGVSDEPTTDGEHEPVFLFWKGFARRRTAALGAKESDAMLKRRAVRASTRDFDRVV